MKIVKASTVYKKAKSVDKAVLLENYVAERIDEAMRRGSSSTARSWRRRARRCR